MTYLAITQAASRTLALDDTQELPMTGTLRMTCSQCGGAMEPKPCVAALDGRESHGLHPACVEAHRAWMRGER